MKGKKFNGLRGYLILVTLSVFVASCSLNFIQQSGTLEQQTREAEELIKKDELLSSLDNLCREIPAPAGYKLVGKSAGSQTHFVEYFYSGPDRQKVDYPAVRSFYIDFYKSSGWQITVDRDFGSKSVKAERDGFEVGIFYATDREADFGKVYAVGCKKSS